MAAEGILEALRTKQQEQGLSLRALTKEIGVSHPFVSLVFQGKRPLAGEARKAVERFLRPHPSANLADSLEKFLRSSVHRSHKTIATLQEGRIPFIDYVARYEVVDSLDITREHVDGFLAEIARGRRGKPLSPASVFGFTNNVQAFINYIADNLAPEDWHSPVRELQCKHPLVYSSVCLPGMLGMAPWVPLLQTPNGNRATLGNGLQRAHVKKRMLQ